MKRAGAVAAAAIVTLATTSAFALEDSTRGPVYVQGSVGLHYWDFPGFFGPFGDYAWTGFNPTVELGFHFSGRHDGPVLGIRQDFIITASNILGGHAGGATVARLGYDFAFQAGKLEINVDPFATIGVNYVFDGPHAGVMTTGGLDVKLFLVGGFYVFARPGELGMGCMNDNIARCAFVYEAGAGAGFAFGK